jgi:cytochrome c biogenesis protein CcmG, thiol:disulfide interchange protein DsbE
MPFRAWGVLLLSLSLIGAVNAAGVGDAAPELKAREWINSASPMTLSNLKDKVVVVEFWATWCGPCVASIPHIIQINNKYKSKNVVLIGMTDQKKAKIEEFVKQNGMPYPIGTSTTSLNDFGVSTIPVAFVIKHGEIYWRGNPNDGLETAIEAALRSNKNVVPEKVAVEAPKPEPKAAVVEAPKTAPAAPSVELLHEVVYVMKDGRRIEADQAVESGEEWAVKDKNGKFQMIKKSEVAEMKM